MGVMIKPPLMSIDWSGYCCLSTGLVSRSAPASHRGVQCPKQQQVHLHAEHAGRRPGHQPGNGRRGHPLRLRLEPTGGPASHGEGRRRAHAHTHTTITHTLTHTYTHTRHMHAPYTHAHTHKHIPAFSHLCLRSVQKVQYSDSVIELCLYWYVCACRIGLTALVRRKQCECLG